MSWQRRIPTPGQEPRFFEIGFNANPGVHKMLDIHATPTVLPDCSGQLVDELTRAGDSGPRKERLEAEQAVADVLEQQQQQQ
ncbi:unnamed protein product, partial [Ectocarpus fasciculatus]